MKKVLVICISILCFTLHAQDIDKLKQSNKILTDSLLVLNLKFNEKVKKSNDKLIVLQSNKLLVQTKLKRQELLKSELENKINKYNITSVNQTIYDTLKRLDIYEVNNEKGRKKINKLRKHLIKSKSINSTDSLLFTLQYIYSFELDQNGRISKIYTLFNNYEIIEFLQSNVASKKYLEKSNNSKIFLEQYTGINQQYYNLIIELHIAQDSILIYTSAIDNVKQKEDSITTYLSRLTTYVNNVNSSFNSKIENNTLKINRIIKETKDVGKYTLKYPTTRFGKVDLCLQPLYETEFKDGTPIQQALTPEHWQRLIDSKTPAFKYKDFDDKNKKDIFYNGSVLTSGLVPYGYHLLNDIDYESLKDEIIWRKNKTKEKCSCDHGFEHKITSCTFCTYWTETQKKFNICSFCGNKGYITSASKQICTSCNGKTFYYLDYYDFEKELKIWVFRTFSSLIPNTNDCGVYKRNYEGKLVCNYDSDYEVQYLICKNPPYKENPNYTFKKIDGVSFVDHFLQKNRFNNGDIIKKIKDPHIDPLDWELAQMKKVPVYFIPSEDSTIGFVYNSYALNDPRGLVPVGLEVALENNFITENVKNYFQNKINDKKNSFNKIEIKKLNNYSSNGSYYSYNSFNIKDKYGSLVLCVNESIDYTNNGDYEPKNFENPIPFQDIDDEKSFFYEVKTSDSGDKFGLYITAAGNENGAGNGGNQRNREPRILLIEPSSVESNIAGIIVFMVTINAEGSVVKANNINSETTITDLRIINQYISNVKSSVRYNKMPGTRPQNQKLTINVKAN